jgi:hypothetical protein
VVPALPPLPPLDAPLLADPATDAVPPAALPALPEAPAPPVLSPSSLQLAENSAADSTSGTQTQCENLISEAYITGVLAVELLSSAWPDCSRTFMPQQLHAGARDVRATGHP